MDYWCWMLAGHNHVGMKFDRLSRTRAHAFFVTSSPSYMNPDNLVAVKMNIGRYASEEWLCGPRHTVQIRQDLNDVQIPFVGLKWFDGKKSID